MPSSHPWPMSRHDAQRTGRSQHRGPEAPALKWIFKEADTSGQNLLLKTLLGYEPEFELAIDASGTIYIMLHDSIREQWYGKLYAVEPSGKGKLKWFFGIEGHVTQPAIGSDGTVYIGLTGGRLWALRPDGTLKWEFKGEDFHPIYTDLIIGTSEYVYDETIYYFGSHYYFSLYALRPNGTLKWQYTQTTLLLRRSAIGIDGTIYLGGYGFGNVLCAVEPAGNLKWCRELGDGISTLAIGTDGTIYSTSSYGRNLDNYILYALRSDGTLRWSLEIGRIDCLATDAVGTVYAATVEKEEQGALYAVKSDGSLKWSLGGLLRRRGARYSLAIGADETIYVLSKDGILHAIGD